MKYRWILVNAAIFLGTLAWGYAVRGPERSPAIGAAVGFTFGVVAVVISLRYAATKTAVFRRPSLDRASRFDWWLDPLQFHLVWSLYIAGFALGSGTALMWAALAGVVVGQAIGYAYYRDRISKV